MPIILPATSSAALITVARASYNSTLAALNVSNPNGLNSLLLAASGKIIRYCHRDFQSTTYTEYYDGQGMPYQLLQLRQFPVTEITRVATNPTTVLNVSNTNATANQRATVQTMATSLRLITVASAVKTTTDLAYTTYPTLTALATAISGTAGGWSATVASGFTLYPSTDLNPLQGAADARNNVAAIEMHVEDLQSQTSGLGGGYYSERGSDVGWRLDAGCGHLWGRFPQGRRNIRVDYTAGFAVVPDAVQEACVLLAQDLYQIEATNRTKQSEGLGPYRYQNAADSMAMSKPVIDLLSEYVAYDRLISD